MISMCLFHSLQCSCDILNTVAQLSTSPTFPSCLVQQPRLSDVNKNLHAEVGDHDTCMLAISPEVPLSG